MPRKIYQRAIEFITDYDSESINIGGGEPTLHPDFWGILGECMGSFDYVWLATNGSQTKIALKLAKMAKNGVIGCDLSRDQWHDPIDPRVVEAFTKKITENGENDHREIRDVSSSNFLSPFRNPKKGGSTENCPCNDTIIMPDGKLKACGCHDAPIVGDIFKGYSFNRDLLDLNDGECWQKNREIYIELGLTKPE